MSVKIVKNEIMAAHTTWQIGGPAAYYAEVTDKEDLGEAIKYATSQELPIFVIGNGSNLLFSDTGYSGLVIMMRGGFTGFTIKHNIISAEAGVHLNSIVTAVRKKSLEGIAFAAGIPGTVGGAIAMNAGGKQGTISDILETVTVYNPKGEVEVITSPEIRFGYRFSNIKEKGIILGATFRLEPGDPKKVTQDIVEATDKRRRTQPIGARTAGSVFKNPGRKFAAELIEGAGCKGRQVGGAVVSRMHANFILNIGEATAEDVVNLVNEVVEQVKERTGLELEREIELIGKF